MKNTIIVSYNPFAVSSSVTIYNQGKVTEKVCMPSGIGELAYRLVSLSYAHEAYDLKIHAPEQFYKELSGTIEKEENRRYAVSKIQMTQI